MASGGHTPAASSTSTATASGGIQASCWAARPGARCRWSRCRWRGYGTTRQPSGRSGAAWLTDSTPISQRTIRRHLNVSERTWRGWLERFAYLAAHANFSDITDVDRYDPRSGEARPGVRRYQRPRQGPRLSSGPASHPAPAESVHHQHALSGEEAPRTRPVQAAARPHTGALCPASAAKNARGVQLYFDTERAWRHCRLAAGTPENDQTMYLNVGHVLTSTGLYRGVALANSCRWPDGSWPGHKNARTHHR